MCSQTYKLDPDIEIDEYCYVMEAQYEFRNADDEKIGTLTIYEPEIRSTKRCPNFHLSGDLEFTYFDEEIKKTASSTVKIIGKGGSDFIHFECQGTGVAKISGRKRLVATYLPKIKIVLSKNEKSITIPKLKLHGTLVKVDAPTLVA